MNTRCHVCRVGQRCPASVTLSWCRHSGANAAFCTLFNESDGIHIPCAAYFAPFPSALTCAIRSWVVFIYLPKRKLPLLGCFGVWREVFCRRIFRWAKKKDTMPQCNGRRGRSGMPFLPIRLHIYQALDNTIISLEHWHSAYHKDLE